MRQYQQSLSRADVLRSPAGCACSGYASWFDLETLLVSDSMFRRAEVKREVRQTMFGEHARRPDEKVPPLAQAGSHPNQFAVEISLKCRIFVSGNLLCQKKS